jgi:hypothetical protein
VTLPTPPWRRPTNPSPPHSWCHSLVEGLSVRQVQGDDARVKSHHSASGDHLSRTVNRQPDPSQILKLPATVQYGSFYYAAISKLLALSISITRPPVPRPSLAKAKALQSAPESQPSVALHQKQKEVRCLHNSNGQLALTHASNQSRDATSGSMG